MESLNDSQKNDNYIMLLRSIDELKSGRKVSDDWEQDHYNFFYKIRKAFHDFRDVNPEVDDEDLRKTRNETEQLARYQEMYLESSGNMHYIAYLQFLERVLIIIQYFMEDEEIDELSSLISAM